MEDKNFFRS